MRELTPAERSLLRHLMERGGLRQPDERWLAEVKVDDLDDGGMGSYVIVEPANQGRGHLSSEVEFDDSDGVKVLASLYVDANGHPCEVDLWKVDFSPLVTLPLLQRRE
ncbi:hypothetical protein QFZ41_002737 [Luteibacter sp. W1I16]